MAGPSVMALGPFIFEAHGFGFSDRRHAQGTRWAEVQVAGSLNAIQWTGGDGITEEIRGVLFPAEFGGRANLDGIYAAAQSGQMLPLVSIGGVGNIFGMWVVEDIGDDHAFIDRNGIPLKNAYQISLRSYQSQGGLGLNLASVLTFF